MLDVMAVQRIAFEMDCYALVIFIEEHRKEYVEYILYGNRENEPKANKEMVSEGTSGEVDQTKTIIM